MISMLSFAATTSVISSSAASAVAQDLNFWEQIVQWFQNFFANLGDKLYTALIEDSRYMYLVRGIGNTLLITFFATIIGITIGMFVALIKYQAYQTKRMKLADKLCNLYLTVIRGTPVVVQLLIMYFVIFPTFDALICAVLAFGINSGAYVAEIVRSGLFAVDLGQGEAGRSLGLTQKQTLRLIVLPQAIKNILPALGNEFIVLLKETSVAGYITIMDLTRAGYIIQTRTYNAFIPYFLVAAVYLIIVVGLTKVLRHFERRLSRSDRN